MTETIKKVYWDACIWISLIMGEADRAAKCEYIIEQAKRGDLQIWTSSLSHAEVFKRKSSGDAMSLDASNDIAFEDYLLQDFVFEVSVDSIIGTYARNLLRNFPQLKKPNDAIHLATACVHNIDELHTYDNDNLLPLDGLIARDDGLMLNICVVPDPIGRQENLNFVDENTASDGQ